MTAVKVEGTVPIMRFARSQVFKYAFEVGRRRPSDRRDPGEAALLVRVGHQHLVCAEGAGGPANENATDVQLRRDHPAILGPMPPNGTSANSRDRSRPQRGSCASPPEHS